jgi:hypothetical protein
MHFAQRERERYLHRLTIEKYSYRFMVNEHGLHKLLCTCMLIVVSLRYMYRLFTLTVF